MRRKLRRFFKTPKGLVTIVLAVFIAMTMWGQGARSVAACMGSSVLATVLVDALILRMRKTEWQFPSGALLTALIVGVVLRAQEPWYVGTVTSVAAVASKYIFRLGTANVFNPAALGLVGSFYLFHAGQSWWGALTDVQPIFKVVLIAGGIVVARRVKKMPLVLTFLWVYFGLFTVTSFVRDPLPLAEVFRTPDFEATLFFAFIILTDPPTSPAKYPDQMICGLVVAVVSWAVFELTGVVYFLLAGVLVGNLWEAWRRARLRRGSRIAPAKARATELDFGSF